MRHSEPQCASALSECCTFAVEIERINYSVSKSGYSESNFDYSESNFSY